MDDPAVIRLTIAPLTFSMVNLPPPPFQSHRIVSTDSVWLGGGGEGVELCRRPNYAGVLTLCF